MINNSSFNAISFSFVSSIHLNDAIQNQNQKGLIKPEPEEKNTSMPCHAISMMCFFADAIKFICLFVTFVVIPLFLTNGDIFDLNWAVGFDFSKKNPMLSMRFASLIAINYLFVEKHRAHSVRM